MLDQVHRASVHVLRTERILRRRNPAQRAIDYMAAYGCGPAKLAQFSGGDLVETRQRWLDLAIHADLRAIEAAIQTHIDEEGCGAVFAAMKEAGGGTGS